MADEPDVSADTISKLSLLTDTELVDGKHVVRLARLLSDGHGFRICFGDRLNAYARPDGGLRL
jgi:hypothetical protein